MNEADRFDCELMYRVLSLHMQQLQPTGFRIGRRQLRWLEQLRDRGVHYGSWTGGVPDEHVEGIRFELADADDLLEVVATIPPESAQLESVKSAGRHEPPLTMWHSDQRSTWRSRSLTIPAGRWQDRAGSTGTSSRKKRASFDALPKGG